MIWKALLLSYQNIQTSSGVRSLTTDQLTSAKEAIGTMFPAVASQNTDGRLTVEVTIPATIGTLVPRTPYGPGWWPSPDETRAELDKLAWGAYDTVFVVAPYDGNALGYYEPSLARGAAYATFPGGADLKTCSADLVTHEFLHGALGFYMLMGYPMPQAGDSADGLHGGHILYPELAQPGQCYSAFYRDLMRGQSRPSGDLGIPLAAWDLGTPRNMDALAGRGSSDPAGFRAAFRELAPAYPVKREGRTNAMAYAVSGGERENFGGPGGDSVVLKGTGLGAFALQPKVWAAFSRGGGTGALGFPVNALHAWSGGMAQDFRLGQTASAVMQAPGRDAFLLPPKSWSAFLSEGGAPVLGYPVNELHDWGEGKTQDFSGPNGSSAIMQGTGRDPFVVPPVVWSAFWQQGGAPAFGYPINALHSWGAGRIQDFRLASGWQTGVMVASGSSTAYVVKGVIWNHYAGMGGATSYLGYPTSNEYVADVNGVRYWMQNFQGGKIRVSQSTQVAEDVR